MCGIGGWISWRQDLSDSDGVMATMAATLACRGPDDEGHFTSPHAAFAHRRLTVIDPMGGRQPMHATDARGRYTLVYNGELYNTEELRRELAAHGHGFRGWSDTEVLLHGYMEWGAAVLSRLNGIFAFAIWDHRRQSLFLGRDRLGVKPLFYWEGGGHFIFGSEIKAILSHPLVPHAVDREGLAELLVVGPARTPGHGIFHGIREVKPGWALTVTPDGLRPVQYWRLESRPHPDDLPTTVDTVRELLRDTVERQLISDVPVATFLSGGLDSSGVTAFAQSAFQARGRILDTYSVDFIDQDRYFEATPFQHGPDTPWARKVARHLGTRHHEVVLDTAALVDHLEEALIARDHPGMADIDISLLMFCREIKRDFTVALSGEAADEVFGGYPWCHRPDALAADTFPWARRLDDRVAILAPAWRERLAPQAYVGDRYRDALAEVPHLDGEGPEARRIREVLYLNLTRFLPTLLDRKDRMSMAVGLEVRVPFCDHRLVEYVWNIPWGWKSLNGAPKGILRAALSGILPDDVVARQKSPYPTTHHPLYAQLFRERLRAVLNDPASPLTELLDTGRVRELLDMDPKAWNLPWFGQMMGVPALFAYLVQLDVWFRRYHVRLVD
jgi:asparagine synthase (glutamine-hydrolysing)